MSKKDLCITIKVIPRAKNSSIVSWENQTLKVRLKAIPEKGKANKELITFLSKTLKIPKDNLTITRGKTSKLKAIKITGISCDEWEEKLSHILG